MSTPATGIKYFRSSAELLQGGVVIRGVFPDGASDVTVPIEALGEEDIVIVFPESFPINGVSTLQEDYAARVTGMAGYVTLIRTDQWMNTDNQLFALLVIRKGIGRGVGITSGNPALIYSHPGGMSAFAVTLTSGSYNDVHVPGINLKNNDIIVVRKLTKISQSDVYEVRASRSGTNQTIRLACTGSTPPDLTPGEIVMVVVFANSDYQSSPGSKSVTSKIEGSFGGQDYARYGISSTLTTSVHTYGPLNTDDLIILASCDQFGEIESAPNRTLSQTSGSIRLYQVFPLGGGSAVFDFIVMKLYGSQS